MIGENLYKEKKEDVLNRPPCVGCVSDPTYIGNELSEMIFPAHSLCWARRGLQATAKLSRLVVSFDQISPMILTCGQLVTIS